MWANMWNELFSFYPLFQCALMYIIQAAMLLRHKVCLTECSTKPPSKCDVAELLQIFHTNTIILPDWLNLDLFISTIWEISKLFLIMFWIKTLSFTEYAVRSGAYGQVNCQFSMLMIVLMCTIAHGQVDCPESYSWRWKGNFLHTFL